MKPYYQDDAVTLYHGDCREVLPNLAYDSIVTDPPYPNNAGHFDESVAAARQVCQEATSNHWLVFWHPLETPPVPLPLVARHAWHRTNTNRPDNYEAIYEFRADGKERACRVLPFAVVHPLLTGCVEATGHPTQKNIKLMHRLVGMTTGVVLDPFAGSGSTLRAAKDIGRRAIGVEVREDYCEQIANRLTQEVLNFGASRMNPTTAQGGNPREVSK